MQLRQFIVNSFYSFQVVKMYRLMLPEKWRLKYLVSGLIKC